MYEVYFQNKKLPFVELQTIIDVRDGTHDSPKAQPEGYLLVTSKHLLPYGVDKITPNLISKFDFDKINERSLVEQFDILMSMIGTIGIVSLVIESEINFAVKNVALFKTSKVERLIYFFLCYLKSQETQRHIEMCLAGSTQKYISLNELRKMPIINPPKSTLVHFNALAIPIFKKIALTTEENQRLSTLRDTLLPKLMSGELDVSEIDI